MENKSLKLEKISLEMLINLLTDLYEQGVNYIDIIGVKEDDKDTVGIAIHEEYMEEGAPELDEKYFDGTYTDDVELNLTDDDINDLI